MIREGDVRAVVERILAFHNPESILVFGSYAKDQLHDGSDLDLIVVEPSTLPRPLRGRDVQGLLAEMPFGIDLLFVTPEELERDSDDPYTMLSTVLPTARAVYRRAGAEA
jgi:predicted nucleotidyltransferase